MSVFTVFPSNLSWHCRRRPLLPEKWAYLSQAGTRLAVSQFGSENKLQKNADIET
jgi:hypothetical protein